MRWPLRNQILLPMVGLMLAALAGVSVLNAYWSVRRTRLRIEHELTQITDTLAGSNFPLTDRVLKQMSGLAGAEFVLTDADGRVIASSTRHDAFPGLPNAAVEVDDGHSALAAPVTIGDQQYFHTAVERRRPGSPAGDSTLHILYPEASYRQAWRDVASPPLLVGGGAIVLVIGFGLAVASRVTRPLDRLQVQVGAIAQGEFRSVPMPKRNDEIADLSRSVNRMAEMLAHYETEVRRNEQLRTLGQLGGGIAHQIRNSVTGCRMAVELHARECPLAGESLEVATRQLELMESFLQRFLKLGRWEAAPHERVALQPIVDNVVALVGPTARHVGVALNCDLPGVPVEVRGDADALEQLLVNLVLNGVEAASQRRDEAGLPGDPAPHVRITLRRSDDGAELAVEDTGAGPADEVAATLFDPFVTEKADGTGLGLVVAEEIATAHGARIHWQRRDATTTFVVQFPAPARSAATP